MPFEFRPAVRESIWTLLGLAGGTGSGKTWTGMRLATGLSGQKKFAVLDTENGRAKFYADYFKFDHENLYPPFTPDRYTEGIVAASKAGYEVILVDSASHEWAGDGGVLDMQEAELDRMAGNDYGKREACKMASWIKPKMEHKAMVQKLLQVRAHVILCFRAEPHIEMAKENNKTVVRPKKGLTGLDGWFPVCEKSLPFEMTSYFLLTADAPGIPKPITLREPHRPFFPTGEQITEECGRKLAEWARGGVATSTPSLPDVDSGLKPELHPRCETCNRPMEFVPAGKKSTGQAYPAFWRCAEHRTSITHEQALAEAKRLEAGRL